MRCCHGFFTLLCSFEGLYRVVGSVDDVGTRGHDKFKPFVFQVWVDGQIVKGLLDDLIVFGIKKTNPAQQAIFGIDE